MSGWRKSSWSTYNGNCVEVAGWRKSGRSVNNGACVEVGHAEAVIAVRDTVRPDGVTLEFPAAAWREFTASLR